MRLFQLFAFLLLCIGVNARDTCLFRLTVADLHWGDGWDNDSLALSVNSQPLWLTPVSKTGPDSNSTLTATLPSGAYGFYYFSTFDGDRVSVVFTSRSSYSSEATWYITPRFNGQAPAVLSGSGATDRTQTFVASCGGPLPSVTSLQFQTLDSSRPWLGRLSWQGNAPYYRIFRKTATENSFQLFATATTKFFDLSLLLLPQGATNNTNSVQFQVTSANDYGESNATTINVAVAPSFSSCSTPLTLSLFDALGAGWQDGRLDVYVQDRGFQTTASVKYKALLATSSAMQTTYTLALPASGNVAIAVDYWAPPFLSRVLEYTISLGSSLLVHSGRYDDIPQNTTVSVTCPQKSQSVGHHLLAMQSQHKRTMKYPLPNGTMALLAATNAGPCSTCVQNACNPSALCLLGICVAFPYPDGTQCAPASQCMAASTCKSGMCSSNPQPNGYPCDDNNPATSGETCQDGVCTAPSSGGSSNNGTSSNNATTTPPTNDCQYILQLFDSYGDGWLDGEYVNLINAGTGVAIASGLYVQPDRNILEVAFSVAPRTNVLVQFVPSSTNPQTFDDSYQVVRNTNGNPIIQSPDGLGYLNEDVPRSMNFVASCPNKNPCNSLTCSPNATCQMTLLVLASCVCNAGYTGDGKTCTELNTICSTSLNCSQLNREGCKSAYGSSVCGPCLSGFTDATGALTGTTQCTAICSKAPNCASLNRQACQSSFNSATCGPCLPGYIASFDGTTNTTGTTLCSLACNSAPNCATLNRQGCQATYGASVCGPCKSRYTVVNGDAAAVGTTQCTLIDSCTGAPNCTQRNRQPCDMSFGSPSCGPCLYGYSSASGSSGVDNTTCTLIDTCAGSPNCDNLNRLACQLSFGYPTCGACKSGYTAASLSIGNTTCTQIPTTCSNAPQCYSLNRGSCLSSYGDAVCGPCQLGYVDAAGGSSNSPGTTQCVLGSSGATYYCMFAPTCSTLNRQPCQASYGAATCGPCNSGYSDNSTGPSSGKPGVTQCKVVNLCTQAPDCASLQRQACQTSYNAAVCGPCKTGYTTASSANSSTGTTQCTFDTCAGSPNCTALKREACQGYFGSATCGACITGYTGSERGTTACTVSNTCISAPHCASLNRQACLSSFGAPTCGPCNSGYTVNGGNGSPFGTTACSSINYCQSAPNCASLNRQACQLTYQGAVCGPCVSGTADPSGGNGSPTGTSQCVNFCAQAPNCTSLNRQPCQLSFAAPICGSCNNNTYDSTGDSAPGITQCQAANPCLNAPDCGKLNRQACQASWGQSTCGACQPGYTGAAGTGTTACTVINYCVNNTCDGNAVCQNNPAKQRFDCVCQTGFSGNGYTCNMVCPTLIVRKEWFDLTDEEKHTFILAMNALYANGMYATIVKKHSEVLNYAHGNAPFLYWHRAYLADIEDSIRNLGGKFSCFAMPYVDWTQDITFIKENLFTNAKTTSGQWKGIGVKNSNCFDSNHPFPNWSYNGYCVRRSNDGTAKPSMPTPTELANAFVDTSFAVVQPKIENYHNTWHAYVGGSMAFLALSPSDPAFWLHHSQVDHLWANWQCCNKQQNLKQDQVYDAETFTQIWNRLSNNTPTEKMPVYPTSAINFLNLGNTNRNYKSNWIDRAISGGTQLHCPVANRVWLQGNHLNTKHLLASGIVSSKTAHQLQVLGLGLDLNILGLGISISLGVVYQPTELSISLNDYSPPDTLLANLNQAYSSFKAAYTTSQKYRYAIQQGMIVDCSLRGPVQDGYLTFSPDMVPMVLRNCALGYCSSQCWKLTDARRASTYADPTTNTSVLLPTLFPGLPLRALGDGSGRVVVDDPVPAWMREYA